MGTTTPFFKWLDEQEDDDHRMVAQVFQEEDRKYLRDIDVTGIINYARAHWDINDEIADMISRAWLDWLESMQVEEAPYVDKEREENRLTLAAAALSGIMARGPGQRTPDVAEQCVRYADAVLAELERTRHN